MFLQKEKVLLLVKLCGFIFLSFMFITALLQMNQMTKENQYSAKAKSKLKTALIEGSYFIDVYTNFVSTQNLLFIVL